MNEKRCALLTMTRNESVMLPVWLRYYLKWFRDEDIFVLDHDSTDGSTDKLGVNIISIHNDKYNDNQWIIDEAKRIQKQLLESGTYRLVLFSHPDEIVIADPKNYPGGLTEYMNCMETGTVRCSGRGVVQDLANEKEIDWNRPIFDQRRWWYFDDHDNKPLLSSHPLDWTWGFHADKDTSGQVIERPIDPSLLMVHLHRVDLKYMVDRHAYMRKQAFKEGQSNGGFHHKWTDEEVVRDYREHQGMRRRIPDRFNGNIL